MVGLHWCMWALFLVSRGYCVVAVRGPFLALTSLVEECGLWGAQGRSVLCTDSGVVAHRASLLLGLWDLLGPGI